MKKKLMATLLALALVLSLVPTVFAADETPAEPQYPQVTETTSDLQGCVTDGNATCKKVSTVASQGAEATVTYTHVAGCKTKCTGELTCPNPVPGNHQSSCKKVAADAASKKCPCDSEEHKAAEGKVCGGTKAADAALCDTCKENATCNPCPVTGCENAKDHEGAHSKAACTGTASCPNAAFSDAANHKDTGCVSLCTGLEDCDNAAGHKANCVSQCTTTANCPNTGDNHKDNCVKLCTMSASCPNTGDNHKANCVALCTFGTDVTVGGDTFHNGETCPNTSGDPSVHKAGCVKATVENSVVLDANGNPVESEKPGEITKAEDFSDVNAGDWFAADLDTVIEKGWVKGNEDGSFDPEGDVSGEQAVVFVSRMLNKGFNTEGENWADEATAWADKDGLTEGIEITSEGIARKDLILLLWRAAGKPASEKEVTFSDLDGVEGDHLTALKWAVENKIILGNDDGTFTPDSTTSRSQISVILVRYDKAVNK